MHYSQRGGLSMRLSFLHKTTRATHTRPSGDGHASGTSLRATSFLHSKRNCSFYVQHIMGVDYVVVIKNETCLRHLFRSSLQAQTFYHFINYLADPCFTHNEPWMWCQCLRLEGMIVSLCKKSPEGRAWRQGRTWTLGRAPRPAGLRLSLHPHASSPHGFSFLLFSSLLPRPRLSTNTPKGSYSPTHRSHGRNVIQNGSPTKVTLNQRGKI